MARKNKNEQLIAELEQQRQVINAQIDVLRRASTSAAKPKPRKPALVCSAASQEPND